MIVIIDYNVGNVKSVCNAFRHIGCQVELSRDRHTIETGWGLVLPGVAAFGYAISELGPLAGLIKELALNGRPLLGICVGYQMLFDRSSEYGQHDGLGLISGDVVQIPAGRTIPHMGWNLVEFPENMDLFASLGNESHFYFAHSFYAKISDDCAKAAYADYGFPLSASVQKANIYGVQFHPEKSGKTGLKLLQNFYEICKRQA